MLQRTPDVAVITILNVPDEPGTSFKIFGLLAQKNINVDMILQSTGRDGKEGYQLYLL